MLSVTNKPFMLSAVMLNVIVLSVVMLNVVALSLGISLKLFLGSFLKTFFNHIIYGLVILTLIGVCLLATNIY